MVRNVSSKTFKKWGELFLRLKDATKNGAIRWSATADDDVFVVALKGAVILFGRREDPITDETDYVIEVKNDEGETVDEFSDNDLDRGRSSKDHYRQMKEMHADIARLLSGADDILDSILKQLPPLEDDIPF